MINLESMLISTEKYIKPGATAVVFFLGPYATPISKIRWSIKSLQRAGYSVITYEYPKEIFRSGDPDKLFIAVDETKQHIKIAIEELQKEGYKEFGFVGSSLGGFIIYNCLGSVPELSWGILNTGGDITEAVWSFQTEREAFENKGFSRHDLEKAWHSLQFPELGDLSNKRYVLITSKGDKTSGYKGAMECFGLIEAAGSDVKVILHKKLGHRATLVRNLLRIRKLTKRVRV